MDFANFMKSQIASSAKDSSKPAGKKYLKRSEIEAQRQANYMREQEQLEESRAAKLEKKRKFEAEEAERARATEEKRRKLAEDSKRIREEQDAAEENARRKRLGLPELPRPQVNVDDSVLPPGMEDIAEEELLVKLQELGEPRWLFGENHLARVKRYRRLIEQSLAPSLSDGPIPTTIKLVSEAEMKVPESMPQGAEQQQLVLRQLASYFDMVLREWDAALARRSRDVRESASGKQAYNSFVAAKQNLRPLFKKIETNDVPTHLFKAVLEIVHLAQLKRYVHANDAYLRLSIGKAAWPIGVTMVGIHERSAREKLHETEKKGNQAHIMSDEVTRKMLQGIKRCLSYAQTRWPPEDISQLMG